MKARLLLAAATALALAGCNSQGDDATPGDDASVAAADPAPAAAPADPQSFADTMAASDMFEIEAGKLAQSMGTSQKVKDFGAMMAKDHTDSSAKLKAAAGKTEPAVTVAPALTPDQQAKLDALKAAGADFDKTYAEQQVTAHEQALATLRDQAANGTAEPLKAFAGEVAPVVEHHLETAKTLP